MYENYYGANPAEEKQKKRIIIVSLIMGIIILVLIGVLINAISKKNHAKTTSQEVAVVDESQNSAPEVRSSEDAQSENVAPVENTESSTASSDDAKSNAATEASSSSASQTATSSNLPQSGPSDYLPLALLFGVTTAYLCSRKIAVAKA